MKNSKEQEETIERLNRFKTIEILYGNTFAMHIEQLKTVQGDIETVLSMLQEQQEENKKKDKIIEEMAKFMTNKDIDEEICRYQVVEHCKDEEHGVTTNVCINCIKQYFERKVEEK